MSMIFNAITGIQDKPLPENLIKDIIPKSIMKALYYTCLRVDIPDNNIKAEIIKGILGDSFIEIGTGTNRIALLHNGVIVKVALDRRGLVDNFCEFKRSSELELILAKTYETNYLINICQYAEVLDQDEFILNEPVILNILKNLSENYLFDDVGFTLKNSYNWGKRESGEGEDDYELCIIDYGYLYPYYGQKEKLLRCPLCQHKMAWNNKYTMLLCTNVGCNHQSTPSQLRQRMDLDFENIENKMISNLNSIQMPNLATVERQLRNIHKGDK